MRMMAHNEDDSNESVVAGSLVAENIRKWIMAKGTWNGTWSELLTELNTLADGTEKRGDGWPRDSRTL